MASTTLAAPAKKEVSVTTAPVSALLWKLSETYEFGKDYALTSKLLARAAKPSLQFIETRASSLKKLSPINLDNGVSTLDTKFAACIHYGQEKKDMISAKVDSAKERPSKIKQGALHLVRDQIVRLNKEEQKSEDDKKLAVRDLFNESYTIVEQQYTAASNAPRVVKVTTKVTESVDTVLNSATKQLEKWIPATKPDAEDQLVAEVDDEARASRAVALTKVAARRVKAQTLSKLTALRLRTVAVVPVDLVKYSKLLDIELLKGKVSPIVESFRGTVSTRIVEPVKNVTDKVKGRALDVTAAARMYREAATSRVAESVGPKYERYVTGPLAQINEAFQVEVAKQKELRGQEDDSKLTILAGLTAVVLTARARAAQEYDTRVAPLVAKVTGKKTAAAEPVAAIAAPAPVAVAAVAATIVEEEDSEDSE